MGCATPSGSLSSLSRDTLASPASTATRSSAAVIAGTLGAEIPQLQHAVGPLHELLHLAFRFGELVRCQAEELDTLFEELERGVQVEAVALQLGYDLFQALEIRFEGHPRNIESLRSRDKRTDQLGPLQRQLQPRKSRIRDPRGIDCE